MSATEISILIRMAERMVSVCIGGLSIYLGYRLFARLPHRADGSGKIEGPWGMSVLLTNVGPGIFFALFGAVIVGLTFVHGIRVDPAKEIQAGVTTHAASVASTVAFSGAVPIDPREEEHQFESARRNIAVLNRDLPRALRTDLAAEEKSRIELARDFAKRLVVRSLWRPSWGEPSGFDTWMNEGAPIEGQFASSVPAALFRAGIEGRP